MNITFPDNEREIINAIRGAKRGRPTVDISEQRFGKLTVKNYLGIINHVATWECLCDCGTITICTGNQLRTGRKKSCGCLKSDKALPGTERIFNDIYRSYKKHAFERNLSFDLTPEQFYTLTQGVCAYCGSTPSMIRTIRDRHFVYNGVDRVDNSKGYSVENCVSCCEMCNWSKREKSVSEFLDWIKRVYDYNHISE